jgi:hypothetical protein
MRLTEKIDGSNAAIRIRLYEPTEDASLAIPEMAIGESGNAYNVWVQSRSRFLLPTKEQDNFGFAAWVLKNMNTLVSTLGLGDHYGEWWGGKIQRGYGLSERRFSLFNAQRWMESIHPTEDRLNIGLYTVPMLYTGPYDGAKIQEVKQDLIDNGSRAVPGFRSEGMVVELLEAKSKYKVLTENDDIHKWEVK